MRVPLAFYGTVCQTCVLCSGQLQTQSEHFSQKTRIREQGYSPGFLPVRKPVDKVEGCQWLEALVRRRATKLYLRMQGGKMEVGWKAPTMNDLKRFCFHC